MASTSNPPTKFPGYVLTAGAQGTLVRAIQQRLNQLGCGPVLEDGVYGAETADAVELFQARSLDKFDSPLQVDGVVGPMTWGALFGAASVPTQKMAATPLLKRVLEVAASQVGIVEEPTGSQRGPQVDEYLRCLEVDPAANNYPWCAAFVYWCFHQAAADLGVANPAVRTAGVLEMWTQAGSAGIRRISAMEALAQPSLVQPGCVFVLSTGSGNGHTGFVEWADGDRLATIEGNTIQKGDGESVGVFRRTGRMVANINRGFIVY